MVLLSVEAPADEPPDVFLFNPMRPVPTSVVSHSAWRQRGGAGDQRAVETRDDVLVYSTPILERPVEVTAPPGCGVCRFVGA